MKADEIKSLKNDIEKLNKKEHIGIMRIFKKYDVEYSENKNGIFINLSKVNTSVLEEIKKHVVCIIDQEKHINMLENQQHQMEKTYFSASDVA
jgi:DNA repair ATPase RecN